MSLNHTFWTELLFTRMFFGLGIQIGRTERIRNCLSPKFSQAFELDYYFEEVQRLRFRVYDLDNDTPEVSDDDFLGQIKCTLGEVRSCLAVLRR
jgi:copine 1/2/3